MKKLIIGLVSVFTVSTTVAQDADTRECGMERMKQRLIAMDPSMQQKMEATLAANTAVLDNPSRALQKTSSGNNVIPVVFHIILNPLQQMQLGYEAGIAARVDSQIAVINRDVNMENPDSDKIPPGFKHLQGNPSIRFALAHTTPEGKPTPGYEIISTTETGFEESGGPGSGMAFSSAKLYNGQATAWDPSRYLNIWVIRMMDNGTPSNILGIATPPSFQKYAIPGMTINEQGVVLNFGAFGVKNGNPGYFLATSTAGRTLTHELGHYFEIWHVWGDDNGKCAGNGGKDDGIADTPPQASESRGCPADTVYDACTSTGAGIMHMNFMDYVNDDCMHMFSIGQATVMNSMIQYARESYSLTQHPELTQWPASVELASGNEGAVTVYPNPGTGVYKVHYTQNMKNAEVFDMSGRTIAKYDLPAGQNNYEINITGRPQGVYIIRISGTGNSVVRKITLQ